MPHDSQTIDARIAAELRARALDGRVNCGTAHQIAAELGVSPTEIGQAANALGIKITRCQLGLFGYAPQRNIVVPAKSVAPDVQAAITTAAGAHGLTCDAAWRIAEQFTMTRLDVSSACEALQIRISGCQLGLFCK